MVKKNSDLAIMMYKKQNSRRDSGPSQMLSSEGHSANHKNSRQTPLSSTNNGAYTDDSRNKANDSDYLNGSSFDGV